MLPIRALNDDLDENSSCSTDSDLKFTGEAEETIIVSEYMKALNLVNAGQRSSALGLFLELLETEALSRELDNNQDSRLSLVKYNCYRNIGLLYQESGDNSLALDYLIHAVELDDNDVYTMCSLAELALKIGQIPVAKIYYEKCLERNPNHWPSLDGMLQLFLTSENIIEAWSWAMHCHKKDEKYEKAISVLLEISNRFSSSRPFMEKLLNETLPVFTITDTIKKSTYLNTTNEELIDDTNIAIEAIVDFEAIKISQINWISLGTLIIQLHQLLEDSGQMMKHFHFKDLLGKPIDILENFSNIADEPSHVPQNETAPDVTDSRSSTNSDIANDIEAKSRRRGSELKILEQWGWHKNRRSSKKKSIHETADFTESTADGFLKRALGQYFTEICVDNNSPFTGEPYERDSASSSEKKVCASSFAEGFLETTKDDLDTMMVEIEDREIDLYLLIKLYLQHLSLHWNKEMPNELRTLYIKIYEIFDNFVNHETWNQLQDDELTVMYRATLFYLELCHDSIERKKPLQSENKSYFAKKLSILQLYASFLPCEYVVIYQSRCLWLNYALSMNENTLGVALNMLLQMCSLFEHQSDIAVNLPNQQYNNFYDKPTIQGMVTSLRRQISLSSVRDLYSAASYQEVVNILKDGLTNASDTSLASRQILSISAQIEILLESLWHLEMYMDCMVWAEKSLKYAVDLFVSVQNPGSSRQNDWAKLINFVLLYVQALIERAEDNLLAFENLPRMVQTIHKLLTNQLDTQPDKHSSTQYMVECWRAWMIIYYILQRQDDINMVCRKNRGMNQSLPTSDMEEESLFSSIMLFFIAHDLLGRRQWCSKGGSSFLFMMLDIIVPILRSPMFEPYRDVINDCLEQTTYCLYGYPPKKGRTRHLQDHESIVVDLTWARAVQLFDIYRPDVLPEFNSYKIDSISADMEAQLQHILLLMPETYAVSSFTGPIMDFINGKQNTLVNVAHENLICFKIRSIYYILADYYFKSRDFSKAIKYYAMDLTIEPTRFDSWAGISLSKTSKCETMLNSAEELSYRTFLDETSSTMRCFEQSLKLNEYDPQVWVEYGSFAYNVSSFCARHMTHTGFSADSLSYLKSQHIYYLDIADESFTRVNTEFNVDQKEDRDIESNEDEKWLYHYMLGKIAEKKDERPVVYLTHYLKAAKCLYECNATYPIKINHSNPSQLSIEALELFYRTSASIMKYTEKHLSICKQEVGLFKKILKELAVSPFAVNRAKISDAALKRKLVEPTDTVQGTAMNYISSLVSSKSDGASDIVTDNNKPILKEIQLDNRNVKPNNNDKMEFSSRRASQESTPVTNTTTTSNATSSMSSISDSQSSGTDSDSSTDEETSITSADRDAIFKDCIRNLEECVIRFPEHYKSVYRLAYHYLNAPGETKSIEKCTQLLLGSYKATLGNQIAGLFTERRSNNFFNGIWRIPSPDIDRPGSFASHLSKCVAILIETLKRNDDHETLLELAIQLSRRPDTDKEYLNDYNRNELSLQAVSTCIIVYQNLLQKITAQKDDSATLTLLVDIFKGYRKCMKNMQHRETLFSAALVEAYKVYIQGKARLPESANLLDLAVKLCTYEINYRKSMEKMIGKQMEKTNKIINTCIDTPSTMITPMQPISASFIPGLTKHRKVIATKVPTTSSIQTIPPASKSVPVGPPSIISPSLPGLTITPVNIPSSSSSEHRIGSRPSNTNVTSAILGATADLLKTFANPETVAEISRMYFSAFPNLSPDEAILHYNKIIESMMLHRSSTTDNAEVSGENKR